ncbi:radical SAM protein [Thermoclostridium stercorarium subsp. leptospartum DSM 9219]|uniref:Radical SAM protein n=1 Tax=Thermoclostridium stercorarium subsp. leptospartum DSM 9219 TaxID=1346611 RepID=A0A1B1YH70_THEST|nr:AmmeMemoRadiSam system radical SAM enzyme [Thermoclostridium stercorarium]ANX00103.1 radical SAM protein [Thermoclostridium stercorarium subsp. leptospartum DSM 9219]
MKAVCEICPHHCSIDEGQLGFCRARTNKNGEIVCENYGKLTSIALDPIEKKPLKRFFPGSFILSVGSYGCNLKCPFCQNYEISMTCGGKISTEKVMPELLVDMAESLVSRGNIGIAYTYNEPLISYEYVMDCARLAKRKSLKNVVVTNGYICEKPLEELLPYIDAMNIDLKSFSNEFYKNIKGDLETVKNTITLAAKNCHVEVTTLIIPGENDSGEEMEELSAWLASISPEIPLHVTRFFPRYLMTEKKPTPVDKILKLADVARKNLRYVYEGNI